jgi:sigma-E factor negative regulatory protein RseA
MSDPVKEQLSVCLDGELPEAELDLLLKQVQRDPRLQQSVTRYALISEVLRTGSSPVPSEGFASRISQAIAAESDAHPQVSAAPPPARREMPRWVRPVGGAAIAAGVAAVAVLVLQPYLDGGQPLDSATAIVADGRALEAANDSYTVPSAAPQQMMPPAAALAGYVMAHSEVAGPLNPHSLLSSVLSDDESELSGPAEIELTTSPAADDTVPRVDPNLRPQP